MQKIKEVFSLSKDAKHGNTTPKADQHLQGADAHKQAGAQEGKAGAGHAKAGIGEKLSKNVAEAKEKLHIGNKHGEATAAKEAHKHKEEEHKAAAAGHADKATDHAHTGAQHVDKARSHQTGTGNTTGAGVATGVPAGAATGVPSGAGGDVIDKKYYTATEDRAQNQEVVDRERQHNLYEKDFKQEVQATGRERQVGGETEVIGAAERVIGEQKREGDASRLINANLPAGVQSERPGGEGWVQGKKGPVYETNDFAVQGDRTVDKERVTALKEHVPVEKEYEVRTLYEGEKPLGMQKESLGREHKALGESTATAPRAAGTTATPGKAPMAQTSTTTTTPGGH